MKKNRASFINIGFSSIVMVFIMICLVTFATLSVLTAHSDYRLSKKVADKTTAYYEADTCARDMMALIDTKLYGIYQTSSSVSAFYEQIEVSDFSENAPLGINNLQVNTLEEFITISYTVSVSEVQNLHVTLKINYPLAESECFSTITRWQTVTENAPDAEEEYLHLHTGNE